MFPEFGLLHLCRLEVSSRQVTLLGRGGVAAVLGKAQCHSLNFDLVVEGGQLALNEDWSLHHLLELTYLQYVHHFD